jgi:Cu/Ag efflux pump CusA
LADNVWPKIVARFRRAVLARSWRLSLAVCEEKNQQRRAAAAHRFRPILLTAAAAILGMIPSAPTVFWGPMAYAIMDGLAVATLLTLVFLPRST